MERFFWEAFFINHVNLSGMNLNEKALTRLLEIMKGCPFLLGFHLSDNNISTSVSNNSNK